MKIAIAGGTGFIGTQLTELLQDEGHELFILTRKKELAAKDVTYVPWLRGGTTPENYLPDIDAIINLAGVSINKGRWTKSRREDIYDSRMQATDELLRIIARVPQKPATFINASAVGIYPTSLDTIYTETSDVQPNDFLGRTVADWEEKAGHAEKYGARTAFMRFGVVLGREAGALPLMTLPYKLFAGGTVGPGRQWLSWVHVTDAARAIQFVLHENSISGPVNVTAPNPLRMKKFGQTIARVLGRPHWIPAPSPAMKLALGAKSKLVLEGQHVRPTVLEENGFQFSFPTLEPALENLVGTNKK